MSFSDLSQADRDALACTYASLILYDGNSPITASKLQTLINSAGLKVPDYYPKLWERGLAIRPIDDIISSAGSVAAAPAAGGSAPAVASGGAAAGGGDKKEKEKEKEKEEEEEDDGGGGGMGGLFGDEED